MIVDISYAGYVLADTWVRAQALQARGIKVGLTSHFEINEPQGSLEVWERDFPATLEEYIDLAREYYVRAGASFERAVENMRSRIVTESV